VKALAPNLFTRRFGDLIEIGRARLRPLAPEWTDHNAHDPGITLMELLAWVSEAQLYSVSRLRRDERAAYAELVGLQPSGTQAARGQIWSDPLDPGSPASTFARTTVLGSDAVIHVVGDERPTFRPERTQLIVPGRIERLERRDGAGRTFDLTAMNERRGPAFLAFGETAGPRDVLALTFVCRDDNGLFGRERQTTRGAGWTIGVLAAPPSGGVTSPSTESRPALWSPLSATFVADGDRVPVPVVWDSTQGLLTTGVLVLDLDGVPGSPQRFTIELRSPRGFARPPRVVRVEPNVIPIQQGYTISRELHLAPGRPDWSFTLNVPGLRFAAGEEPVKVEIAEPAGLKTWERRDRLSDCGPADRVFELDAAAGEVTFGNGVNGRIPSEQSQVLVSYSVCDGEEGNLGRNRKWSVAGFGGVFGVNVDPITGGRAPFGWLDERRDARRLSKTAHALVSADDLIAAARALPLLEVVRAWVPADRPDAPRTGVTTLVAMRSRPDGNEPEGIPETSRWLDAIRRRLLPRIPLGARLSVVAPRYVGFSIRAKVESHAGRDPITVEQDIRAALNRTLTLVDLPDGTVPRQPGVPVTGRDVGAWIRSVDGVKRVTELQLQRADGRTVQKIAVPARGLPKWQRGPSAIEVTRPGGGAR
jgi:predicted phage baseplate assembly protein